MASRKSLKVALLAASGCSVVAEALTWVLASMTAGTASDGIVYRFCAGFHGPPEAVRFCLFRTIENHPTSLENIGMMLTFFGTACLQWFCIFILGFIIVRSRGKKLDKQSPATS